MKNTVIIISARNVCHFGVVIEPRDMILKRKKLRRQLSAVFANHVKKLNAVRIMMLKKKKVLKKSRMETRKLAQAN